MNNLNKNSSQKEARKALSSINNHVKSLKESDPNGYNDLEKVWNNFVSNLGKNSAIKVAGTVGVLGKFVVDSIPHVITAVSEDKNRTDILKGEITREDAYQRVIGRAPEAMVATALIKSSVAMGSNPNAPFSGDLFKIVIGLSPGTSAVEFAIKKNNYNAVKALLNTKGDTERVGNYNAPIHDAFGLYEGSYDRREKNADVLRDYIQYNRELIQKLVIERTQNVNVKNVLGENALHVIARRNEEVDVNIIKQLVNKGINLNAKDNSGDTPLHIAANVGNVKFIDAMRNFTVDATIKNNKGFTPLHIAALADEADSFESLLKLGAKLYQKDLRGKTPLQYFENDKNLLKYRVVKDQKSEEHKQIQKEKLLEKYKHAVKLDNKPYLSM